MNYIVIEFGNDNDLPQIKVNDVIPEEYKSLAWKAEEIFRRELSQTDLGLLYYRHNCYNDYVSYFSKNKINPSILDLFFSLSPESFEDRLDMSLVVNNIQKAREYQKKIYELFP